jgi:hypothetical protein
MNTHAFPALLLAALAPLPAPAAALSVAPPPGALPLVQGRASVLSAQGTIASVNPAQGTLAFTDGAQFRFPHSKAMQARLARFTPGQTVVIDLARPGDDASAVALALREPLDGYPAA